MAYLLILLQRRWLGCQDDEIDLSDEGDVRGDQGDQE